MRELTRRELAKELLITQTYSDFTLNSTLKLFIKVELCKDVLLAHEGPERHVSSLARRYFACARICFGLVRARKAHNNCKFTKVKYITYRLGSRSVAEHNK